MDEYEATRNELKSALLSLEGPDGTSVCERVVEKEEAFSGGHDEIAPDLVAIPTAGFDLKAGFKEKSVVFDTGPRNGMHSFSDASLIIDDDAPSISGCDLFDIAPTILSLMDIPFDEDDFDGRSLV